MGLYRNGIAVPKVIKVNNTIDSFLISKPKFGACHKGIDIIPPGHDFHISENNLIQEYIIGKEFTVGVLEIESKPKALTPLEIVFSKDEKPSSRFLGGAVPISYESSFNDPYKLKTIAEQAFKILGLRDYARFDFRVSDKPYLIDANGLPNLHPKASFLPKIAQIDGISYDQLICLITESAIRRFSSCKD